MQQFTLSRAGASWRRALSPGPAPSWVLRRSPELGKLHLLTRLFTKACATSRCHSTGIPCEECNLTAHRSPTPPKSSSGATSLIIAWSRCGALASPHGAVRHTPAAVMMWRSCKTWASIWFGSTTGNRATTTEGSWTGALPKESRFLCRFRITFSSLAKVIQTGSPLYRT